MNQEIYEAVEKIMERERELCEDHYTAKTLAEAMPDVDKLARMMHDTYEIQAKIVGWKTQESCQVAFDDLPEANKKVMYAVAKAIHDKLLANLKGQK